MPFQPGMGAFGPPVANTYIDTSGWPPGMDGAEAAGDALVQQYAGAIHQQVAAARQSAIFSGNTDVARNFTAANGAVVGRYILNHGQETLTLLARPVAEKPAQPETGSPDEPGEETWLPAKFQPGCYVQRGDVSISPLKAVLSLWFRVPQASITAAANAYDPASNDPMNAVIPLVVFGAVGYVAEPVGVTVRKLGTGGSHNMNPQITDHLQGGEYTPHGYTTLTNYQTAAWPLVNHVQTWDYTGAVMEVDKGTQPTEPSYLGVYCGLGGPRLVFNIQTGAKAEITCAAVTATAENETDIVQYVPGKVVVETNYEAHFMGYALDYIILETGVVSYPQAPDVDHTTTWTDVSATAYNSTEVYRSTLAKGDGVPTESTAQNPPTVSADTWHHVMFAFDLTTPCETAGAKHGTDAPPPIEGVISAPKIWMSLDGRVLAGKDLSEYCPDGGDPNEVLTINAWKITQMSRDELKPLITELHVDSPLDPTNSYTIHYIYDGAVAPAHFMFGPTIADPVANPQPFGLPADARYAGDIRPCELGEFQMFVGVPPPPDGATELFVKNRRPVNPAVAKKALGEPVVSITRHSENWLAGRNLGTGGTFGHTKGIAVYRNNPKLTS